MHREEESVMSAYGMPEKGSAILRKENASAPPDDHIRERAMRRGEES
jgi:hypothetical protein